MVGARLQVAHTLGQTTDRADELFGRIGVIGYGGPDGLASVVSIRKGLAGWFDSSKAQ
jgi:hypothetical protein